jgi:DNA polymerase III alpha subunit
MPKRKPAAKPKKKSVKTKTIDVNKGNVRCHVSIGKTINMGNYNSAKVDIGIARDLQAGETVESTFKQMDDFLSEWMEKYCNEKELISAEE